MAIVKVPSTMSFPDARYWSVQPAAATATLNTIGHKAGFIFQAPVSDDIVSVTFRTQTVNAGDIDVRIETFDPATGYPTGTLWGTNTNAIQTLLASDDNTWFTVTLTAAATVVKGDYVCVVLESDTTSLGAVFYSLTSTGGYLFAPYPISNTGSWGRSNGVAMFGVEFGTNGYVPIMGAVPAAVSTYTFNNTSTPDVRGNIINMPFKCKVTGAWFTADTDGNFDIILYGTNGSTILTQVSIDKDYPALTSAQTSYVEFEDEITLDAGSTYYLVFAPSSATSMTTYSLNFASADVKKCYVDASCHGVSAKDPTGTGSWTADTTIMYTIGVIISGIDNGAAGAGGLAANPVRGFIS